MTPDERDRLAKVETRVDSVGDKIDDLKESLEKRLDKQDAQLQQLTGFMERHKGGIAAIVALGSLSGLITSAVAFLGAKSAGIIK